MAKELTGAATLTKTTENVRTGIAKRTLDSHRLILGEKINSNSEKLCRPNELRARRLFGGVHRGEIYPGAGKRLKRTAGPAIFDL